MVKCEDCKQEMRGAESCSIALIKIKGQVYKRDTEEFDVNKRCHDCGIINKKGNIHHFECDVERCPKCKGQLLSCSCKDKELVC